MYYKLKRVMYDNIQIKNESNIFTLLIILNCYQDIIQWIIDYIFNLI